MLIGPNERKPGTAPAPGGAMAGLDPHQQAEIEIGHMEQIPFLDVLPSPEPDPAHTASPVQRMLEASFDQFVRCFPMAFPAIDDIRTRLLYTPRRASWSPRQEFKPLRLGSAILDRHGPPSKFLRTSREK